MAKLSNSARGSNVQFLEQRVWVYNGVRFLGCTLWSDLGGDDNEQLEELVSIVNDFRKIRYRTELLNVDNYRRLHQKSREWIVPSWQNRFPEKP